MSTTVRFGDISNAAWQAAVKVTGYDFGIGTLVGNEVVFKHFRDDSIGGQAFRFLPAEQVFIDHHQTGSAMALTPARFVAQHRAVPRNIAARIIEDHTRGSTPIPKGHSATRASNLRNVQEQQQHGNTRIRNDLLTAFFNEFENKQRFIPENAMAWWRDKRCLDPRSLRAGSRRVAVVANRAEAEKIANTLGWTDSEKLASSLWLRNSEGQLFLQWIGQDRQILFPCWNFARQNFVTKMVVTGVRSRWTNPTVATATKEVALSVRQCIDHERVPATLGLFGLLKPFSGDSPLQAQFEGCPGFTIVLCEGVIEIFAGEELLCLEQPQLNPLLESRILFVSAGSLGCATWTENLMQIAMCQRLIIAFNDDSVRSSTNTGQKAAEQVARNARSIGIRNVDILPRECLEGCNDLNDLLKKRKAEMKTEPHADWLRRRTFGRYIIGEISYGWQ